jgi:hypothetical protein
MNQNSTEEWGQENDLYSPVQIFYFRMGTWLPARSWILKWIGAEA